MKTSTIRLVILTTLVAAGVGISWAQAEEEELPAGPIRERHELMEGLGSNAKKINDMVRSGKTEGIAEEAEAIRDASKKLAGLFPQGSTDPKSRASEVIWKEWDRFQKDAQSLTDAATALAAAARSGNDLGQVSGQIFQACKSCHQTFRLPEE